MKKLLLVLTLVILAGALFTVYDHYSNYFTGTTTAAYVATEAIECQSYSQKYIHIENTGKANAMLYKVYGYPTSTSTYYEEVVSETTIAASGSDDVKLANTAYAKLVFQVKWVSAATTYTIGYNLIP